MEYIITKIQQLEDPCWLINSIRPEQNDRHFANNETFKLIFFNENVCILIQILLNVSPGV